MNNITRSIFRAIHEGRWLSIEYKNQQTQQTKYWVAIRGLNPRTRTLNVDGLHLGKLSVQALDHISIDRIQTAEVVDGSGCPVNRQQDAGYHHHRRHALPVQLQPDPSN